MNEIQALLDRVGIPWRESRASLAARFGVADDPWWEPGRPIVLAEIAPPPFPGLLRPLAFEAGPRHDPALPPIHFSGYVWTAETRGALWWKRSNAFVALDRVAAQLTSVLGKPEPPDPWITGSLTHRWSSGPASIEATAWQRRPPHERFRNVVHEREPRTASACSVVIRTGYRPPCSDRERDWLARLVLGPSLDRPPATPAGIAAIAPHESALELTREPCPGFEPTIGRLCRSPDGEALIFTTSQFHVVPVALLDRISVERMQPGRGGGGAWLHLVCRAPFDAAIERRLCLDGGYGGGADSLNAKGEALADWLGIPCVLEPYSVDY